MSDLEYPHWSDSFLARRFRRSARASMSNFGCSTRARNPGARNQSAMNTSANRVTIATIQSIMVLLLFADCRRGKERADVAAEKLAVGVGKLTCPGRHRCTRDTVFQYVEGPLTSRLLQVEVRRRGCQRSRSGSMPVAAFSMARRTVFGEE